MYEKVKFGELPNGQEVHEYTLINKNGLSLSLIHI